jgi:tripartite-type tricarboxylate transporter receptor subunit TctC
MGHHSGRPPSCQEIPAFCRAVAACVVPGGIATVSAQEFPTRPIHMIVPLTPGSGADIAGRIVSKHMTLRMGQPVVVENRPGAGGQIGTVAVIKSPADGYTVMVQSASHAANSAIYKTLQYDPLKELVDVAILGMTPYVMVTSPTGHYKTIKSLVDAAKAKPEEFAKFVRSEIATYQRIVKQGNIPQQ